MEGEFRGCIAGRRRARVSPDQDVPDKSRHVVGVYRGCTGDEPATRRTAANAAIA